MIIFGIVWVVLGFVIFLLAMRGRVAARGQFCKKCKFDLAGLDLDPTNAKCPECGSEIHQESARQGVLRRQSKLGLVSATILILSGIGTLGFWASGNASVILKPMPNWAVVGLTDIGMDAALDELVVRVSMVPNPLSASQMNSVIESGLAHQADLAIGFDPGWGEVLFVSCVNGQMSDEQLKQYMLNGVSAEVLIRDRVHWGARKIDALIKISPTRMSTLNGGYTGYSVTAKWVAGGVVNTPARKWSPPMLLSAIVRAPRPRGWWETSAPLSIIPTGGALNGEIGSKLPVYTEYDLVLSANSEKMSTILGAPFHERDDELVLGRFRAEHEVEIIDPNEPIVPVVRNPELARRSREAIGILPIRLLKTVPEPDGDQRTSVFSMSTQANTLPQNIALRAYIRFDDGEEIEFGQWVTLASGGHSLSGIQWSVANSNAQEHAKAQAVVDKMFKQGQVDVIFRTDAAFAEFTPEIDQVIDLAIVFEDVPIVLAEDVSRMSSSTADDWIKGKIIEQDEGEDSEQP